MTKAGTAQLVRQLLRVREAQQARRHASVTGHVIWGKHLREVRGEDEQTVLLPPKCLQQARQRPGLDEVGLVPSIPVHVEQELDVAGQSVTLGRALRSLPAGNRARRANRDAGRPR